MKIDRQSASPRLLVILGMSIPILLMVIIGYLQWQSARDFHASREWATRTRMILMNMESLLACMNAAETSQRGYLLTHKESYLEPYKLALTRYPEELRALREFGAKSPELRDDLNRLEPLVKAKLDELAQTVKLEKNMDHAGALKVVMNDFGKETMDQIRATLQNMHDIEANLLQQREAAYQRDSSVNFVWSSLLIGVCLCFIVAVFLLLHRMEKMQDIVKICAWSKMIEFEGEWLSIEEYLTKRLNAKISHGMSDVEAQKMLRLIEQAKPRKAA